MLMRVVAVAAGLTAALSVWALARLTGADVETVRKSGEAVDLPAHYVGVVAVLSGLAGWVALAVLERVRPRQANPIWYACAAVVLAGVLVHVALETELTFAQKSWLGALCLAVAGVLVLLLPRRDRPLR